MDPRRIVLRSRAVDDVDAAIDHLRAVADVHLARQYVDALESALRRLGRWPNSGSLRWSYDLGVPELRVWPLHGFPYVVVYVATDDSIDVWRVLHTRRDIAADL